MAMTLDENGQLIPLDEGPLTEKEKREMEYVVNFSTPLVVERGSYVSGARITVSNPYAVMNTPINVNIECIRGYKVKEITAHINDRENPRYMTDKEYMLQDNGTRTKLLSFMMPMADVDLNIILEKD